MLPFGRMRFSSISTKFSHQPCVQFSYGNNNRNTYAPAEEKIGEFRVPNIRPVPSERRVMRKNDRERQLLPPRATRMSTVQDWKSVWPAARMFHPAVVPLPVHMGSVTSHFVQSITGAAPDKWANAELMKIPNFLHLTPPHITAHCKAIKKFCTPWPDNLEKNDEECWKHFPLEFAFREHVHAAPTIRDPKARIVRVTFKLSSLPLDKRAKYKAKRILLASKPVMYDETLKKEIVPPRYDPETDLVTLYSDKLPLKMQNYEYLKYVMTALFFESCKVEPWEETDMGHEDWEEYQIEKTPSHAKAMEKIQLTNPSVSEKAAVETAEYKEYKRSVCTLFDGGENEESLEEYRRSVEKLLFPGGQVKAN